MPLPAMAPWMWAALVGGGTSTATGYMRGNRGEDLLRDLALGAVVGAGTSGLGSMFQGSQAATAAGKTVPVGGLNTADLLTKNSRANMLANLGKKSAVESVKNQPWKHVKNKALGQALDPFGASAGDLGKYAYLTTPTAAMAGQMAFGNKPKLDPRKQFAPPFNVHYGRDPGQYGFGDWFDADAIKERYTEESMDNPYYYPEMDLAKGGEVRRGYQEGGLPAALGAALGGSQEGTTDAIQSLLSEYYNQEEQIFEDDTKQALI